MPRKACHATTWSVWSACVMWNCHQMFQKVVHHLLLKHPRDEGKSMFLQAKIIKKGTGSKQTNASGPSIHFHWEPSVLSTLSSLNQTRIFKSLLYLLWKIMSPSFLIWRHYCQCHNLEKGRGITLKYKDN